MRPMMILALTAAFSAIAATASAAPTYTVAGSIAGPDGSWDYARIDADAHRLYVARAASVTVADLGVGGQVMSWGTLSRGHAVVPLPANRLLVTSGNDATVRFFDTSKGSQIASVAVGKKPDAAIFDASHHRAFIMNSDSGTISVMDTDKMAVTATITAKEALEYGALAKDGTLFVNDEDANEVEVIDVVAGMMGKPIAMPGCEGPTGLGYDAKQDRLISACANGKAAIIDAKAHKLLALVDIGKGADAVIMDEARRLAFIPCGQDGVLDIISLDAAATAPRMARVTTEAGARTGALDPSTGIVYLPAAKYGAPAAAGQRPSIVPGSFHIIVVKPS